MNFVAHGVLISFSFWGETIVSSPPPFLAKGGALNLLPALAFLHLSEYWHWGTASNVPHLNLRSK